MERVLKIAKSINHFKTTSGLKPKPLPVASYGNYFETVLREHTIDEHLQLQEMVAKEVEQLGFDSSELRNFVFYSAVQILMEPYRQSFLKTFDNNSWKREVCPFCGSNAGVARLTADGTRKLVCYLCWTEWDYPRIKCFFCGKDSSGYALFEVDNKEVRVDYCDSCKMYIKTFIFDHSEDPYPIWDLKTLQLDNWAKEKGYTKPTPTLVGIDFSK